MTNRTRLLTAALATAAALAAVPSTAQACWDGVYVETDTVSIAISTEVSEAEWSPERARSYAKWAGRIAALVPAGHSMSIEHGYISVCDLTGECKDIEQTWEDPYLSNLFELTADVLDTPRGTVARARRTNAEPMTVQVAATRNLDGAYKLANEINDAELELHGFLDVGGFPAMNEYAHVVESWKDQAPMYHVVVGSYLDRDDAEAAAASVETALGMHGFVRKLDQWSVEDELGC